jgi:hypothetical protein
MADQSLGKSGFSSRARIASWVSRMISAEFVTWPEFVAAAEAT